MERIGLIFLVLSSLVWVRYMIHVKERQQHDKEIGHKKTHS